MSIPRERKYLYKMGSVPVMVFVIMTIAYLAGVESELFKTIALMLAAGSAIWVTYWVIIGP